MMVLQWSVDSPVGHSHSRHLSTISRIGICHVLEHFAGAAAAAAVACCCLLQIPTGLEIVGKVFQFTQWP
jgi:hypothetical protein